MKCMCVILRLAACSLVFVVGRNAGITGNGAFLRAVDRRRCISADGGRYRRYFSLRHAFPRSFRNCFMCSLICSRLSGLYNIRLGKRRKGNSLCSLCSTGTIGTTTESRRDLFCEIAHPGIHPVLFAIQYLASVLLRLATHIPRLNPLSI